MRNVTVQSARANLDCSSRCDEFGPVGFGIRLAERRLNLPGFALRFSEFPGTLDLQAPLLGEHNEEILTRYLAYPLSRVRDLERKGILHSAPR